LREIWNRLLQGSAFVRGLVSIVRINAFRGCCWMGERAIGLDLVRARHGEGDI
jgi:hypothetical protein